MHASLRTYVPCIDNLDVLCHGSLIWQAKSRQREAIEAGILIRGVRPAVITFPVNDFLSPSMNHSIFPDN
jgi:hypothetical protein